MTTTCSGRNVEFVTKQLGADVAVDYTPAREGMRGGAFFFARTWVVDYTQAREGMRGGAFFLLALGLSTTRRRARECGAGLFFCSHLGVGR